jgi:hypothetical protein
MEEAQPERPLEEIEEEMRRAWREIVATGGGDEQNPPWTGGQIAEAEERIRKLEEEARKVREG